MTTSGAQVTVLIADDEPLAREGLRDVIDGLEWLRCVGEAANGSSAAEMIDRLKPELVLLDIQMPGRSGIEVFRRLAHQPYVIFTTAYAEHAVTAFELGAVDYLLKPFGAPRLLAALDRVRAAIGEPVATPTLERLADALGHGPISRLFVRSGHALLPVSVDSVLWFEADGDYVIARTARAKHLMHLALSRLEARLDATQFVRIHRTHIVNMAHVAAFKRDAAGRVHAAMSDGTSLPVSRTRAQELRGLGA